jgi:hypothetical protein
LNILASHESAGVEFTSQLIWSKTISLTVENLPFTATSLITEINKLAPLDRTAFVTTPYPSVLRSQTTLLLSMMREFVNFGKEVATHIIEYYLPDPDKIQYDLHAEILTQAIILGWFFVSDHLRTIGFRVTTKPFSLCARSVSSVLFYVIEQSDINCLSYLIQTFPEVDLSSCMNPMYTPLAYACHLMKPETIKILLQHGASTTCEPEKLGSTLTRTIIAQGNFPDRFELSDYPLKTQTMLKTILEIIKIFDGTDAFFHVASHNCVFAVVLFVYYMNEHAYCARLLSRYNWLSRTSLLIQACEKCKKSVVGFLLEQGADPNMEVHNESPLLTALLKNPKHGQAICKLLISRGARPDSAIHHPTGETFVQIVNSDKKRFKLLLPHISK